jgi:integrase
MSQQSFINGRYSRLSALRSLLYLCENLKCSTVQLLSLHQLLICCCRLNYVDNQLHHKCQNGRGMTARRRGKGEGSIYRRASDGRWVAALIMYDGRRVVRRASSRKDAAAKLELLLKARAEGQALAADRSTAAFLTDWLAVVRNTVALGTFERYEQYVRVHAIPALGRIRLGRLTPQHFQRLYQEKLAAGLSPTVSHLHTVLHGAFAEAVRWGLLSRNVVALVRPPRKVHVEVVALTVEEARALLAAAAGTRFEVLFVLALKTGMRRGELLALRWEDVDLDKGVLQVRGTLRRTREGLTIGTPKTAASRRRVVLSPSSVAALRGHRARQQQERQAAGDLWQDFGLVFPNTLGRPMEPRCLLSDVYRPLLKRAGLPPVTFHALRHTAATLLLAEGEHPKVVQELLGHAQVSITLDRYSHMTPRLMSNAAALMDRLLDADQDASQARRSQKS